MGLITAGGIFLPQQVRVYSREYVMLNGGKKVLIGALMTELKAKIVSRPCQLSGCANCCMNLVKSVLLIPSMDAASLYHSKMYCNLHHTLHLTALIYLADCACMSSHMPSMRI